MTIAVTITFDPYVPDGHWAADFPGGHSEFDVTKTNRVWTFTAVGTRGPSTITLSNGMQIGIDFDTETVKNIEVNGTPPTPTPVPTPVPTPTLEPTPVPTTEPVSYTHLDVYKRQGLTNVAVELTEGRLSDHYDPRAEVIRLSREVYYNATVAAVGVAAHECGHAVQHAEEYFPLRVRSAIIPVTQIGSKLAFPLFLLGLLFSYPPLMDAGILLFALVAVFQLVTLPVEYNASNRAVATLSGSGMVSAEEERGVRKVLSACLLYTSRARRGAGP